MGIAAAEFFSANDTEKQTLSRRIVPTPEQMEDQRERWDALAEHLRADLSERAAYPVRHWLQGSYKFGTQVRPPRLGEEFDIDLGVYYEWEGEPDEGTHSPRTLKDFVQESLGVYAGANCDDVIEVTSPRPRCCRIQFKDDFHIDVPTYHLDETRDARSLATHNNEWEDSDPKALYNWFKNKFDDGVRTKARRHVRYLKAWAGLKFPAVKRPSSVLLTVIVTEAISELSRESLASDDEAFRTVVDRIIVRLDKEPVVKNPVNSDEKLSARLSKAEFEDFLQSLCGLAAIAKRGVEAGDLISACDIWSEAFDQFFPAPDEKELAESAVVRAMSKSVAVARFDPIVQVTAQAKNNSFRKWDGIDRIGPIPKDCVIDFRLQNCAQVPYGAEVKWIVRNEGLEAERINDLGHRGGTGVTAREHSAYNGTHYMDCIVRKNGQVVGFKRVAVQIAGAPAPRRNPLKRPDYVRFNRR